MYKLITFYDLYAGMSRTLYIVYGHHGTHDNDSLGEYLTFEDAARAAFEYGVPVMLGAGKSETPEARAIYAI